MKKLFSVLLVTLMVFLVLAPSVSAVAEIGVSKTATKPTTPMLRFYTRDPATGKALGNVTLEFLQTIKTNNKTTTKVVKTLTTDKNGKTSTFRLNAGSYTVRVKKAPSGYAVKTTQSFSVRQYYDNSNVGRQNNIYVDVAPLFSCKVKVVDNKGKVVPNAFVDICAGNYSASGTTDSKGYVTLKNIKYGTNHVVVEVRKNDSKTRHGGTLYSAYDKNITLKANSKATLNKTIKLPAESKWKAIGFWDSSPVCYKPMIYVYSSTEQDVNVKLGKPENLLVSYPEYPEDGWKVTAHTNGLLTDSSTGRGLYGLYWEGKNRELAIQNTGFVVAREDVVDFLEEKLAYLGLNELEAEEFIVYWLPKLQANEFNYIRFATAEEIEECMPLETAPAADNVIRVWMEYTALDEKIEMDEQPLDQIVRADLNGAGLLVVEWGGSEF